MEETRLTRTDIQNLAIEAAIPVLEREGKATLLMGTGTGKGLSILRILDHFKPEKITWLIDSTDGRDTNDSAEFYKHGYEHLLPFVEFSCYQTAFRWRDKDLGFLVLNEADYGATQEYSKAVSENKYSKILMATATIAESKQWFFDKYAPVVFTFTTQQAEDAGVINKKIYKFINYDLSTEKNIEMNGKYGKYYQSEQDQYIYWDNQFISTTISLENHKKACKQHYDGIKKIEGFSYDTWKKQRDVFFKKLQYIGSQRSAILYNSKTSIQVAKKLVNHILEDENSKVVVISKFTDHIDSICEYTWHSKNSGTKKEPNINKDLLNEGKIRCLGVCGKISRGTNLNKVNNFIWETFDGSPTTGQQQGGRANRIEVDDLATIWIQIPYFWKNGKRLPTRAYSFAMKRLADFELTEKNVFNLNINEL